MWALTRALQLELGITATSTTFGNGTLAEITKNVQLVQHLIQMQIS